ncbi:hypothetical protein JI742_07505 [Piscinibacter sp. Jin2]|uniref:Uncharacterized protein n=1 Tax=Aquariibacter lacus TaxID=2801332 RepID=A0A9X1BNE9_9BURK|nr:BPSL0761 family protein [Piscinibacter lacus]MBL0719732.1 hypothetical protein [Piscinibacter lacus]
MTTPYERTRALLETRQFLDELTSSESTPGVPDEIRCLARQLLRHYPGVRELDLAHKALPMFFAAALPPPNPTTAAAIDDAKQGRTPGTAFEDL